jgi:hypothetical protein
MKNDWTKMRADLERELQRTFPETRAESAESGTIRSRRKTSGVIWQIIFWAAIVGGAIALFEFFR